jgi:hypothetical protein
MHQLLASTMHRGRCFLAGDAAHINNPIGGLGLCTGLLDADALHQALKIVFSFQSLPQQSRLPHLNGTSSKTGLKNPSHLSVDPQAVFTRYSSERRRVFQNIIHPYSSANKTRLHGGDPDETARQDWYFEALARGDPQELQNIHGPLYSGWRTNMWAFLPEWSR